MSSVINTLRFTENNGMLICTIGNRLYRVSSQANDKNAVLFPIISVQDELLKRKAITRLERQCARRKDPNEIKTGYEPLWAAFERHSLNNNPKPTK